jgi:hypothetical protein
MGTMHDVIPRVRAEYLEMPRLRLTPEQMQRLCGVESTLLPNRPRRVHGRALSLRNAPTRRGVVKWVDT